MGAVRLVLPSLLGTKKICSYSREI